MADDAIDRPTIRRLPLMARRILRCREHHFGAASDILGIPLPREAYGSASRGKLHALWLGPDEWLFLADGAAGETLSDAAAKLAALGAAFVDVSHRQHAIAIAGGDVEACLASGCPLDLSPAAFPVGACARTLFHKAEVVLWRTRADGFHLEVWRSFTPYVEMLLTEARDDLAIL